MPITILEEQRRFRELGRIRLGEREPVMRDGKQVIKEGKPVFRPKRRPDFRLTSPWRHLLDAAQVVYGGEVKPWAPSEGRNEFELATEASLLEVLIPPGEVLSQWLEEWSGGGCARRCDGARMVIANGKSADRACQCSPDGTIPIDKRSCKPTTRLLVMVPGVPDLGVWRLESHGINAAIELGKSTEFLAQATARGVIIPAELRIENREVRKPGEPLKRFVVPTLGFRFKLGETLEALGYGDPNALAMIGGTGPIEPRPALNAGGAPELSEGEPTDAREAAAKRGPGPVEESSLPPATGGAATERQEPGAGTTDVDDEVADAELIDEEPKAFEPPKHDPNAEEGGEGGGALTPAQFVAIRARENDVDDDTRHAVIGIVTRGRTRTGKELTGGDEVTRVVKVFEAIKVGKITVARAGDGDATVWTFTDAKGPVMVLNPDNTIARPDLGEHADERGDFKKAGPRK